MPESGKYLVAAPLVEDENILVLMFPQQSDGSLGLWAYSRKDAKACDLMAGMPTNGRPSIENFNDF